MEDVSRSGVTRAAAWHEPAMNVPEKTKHAWSLQKQQQGCQRDAAWVSLRFRVNSSVISPQPQEQSCRWTRWTTGAWRRQLPTVRPHRSMSTQLLLHNSGPQHTRVCIVSCYVTDEVIPARCPGWREWEDRCTASAFFHHSQNVPPPLTSAPVHQHDSDIQTWPRSG